MKRILLNYGIFILAIITLTSSTTLAVNFPAEKEFTNSVGMKFVRVESGNFRMGFEGKSLPEVKTHGLSQRRFRRTPKA
ncbi:MAG: hypothetical protein ACYTBV_09235 [Planctomycetota bacterium]|jgi:formylglycine-generating enzyme required for sulfatase activity